MATEVKLPELAENLESGEVVDVNVSVGDVVAEGQTLFEVEAEKSTVEVPAPVAGRVAKILVKKGDKVTVGQAICLIESAAAGERSNDEVQTVGPVQKADSKEQKVQRKAASAGSAEKGTEQVAVESPEPVGPRHASAPSGDGRDDSRASASTENNAQPSATRPHLVAAGPATRRLARELGVDLSQVTGSARGGRVTQDDVKSYVRRVASAPAPQAAVRPGAGASGLRALGPD